MRVLGPPLIVRKPLGRWVCLSKPQFPHVCNGNATKSSQWHRRLGTQLYNHCLSYSLRVLWQLSSKNLLTQLRDHKSRGLDSVQTESHLGGQARVGQFPISHQLC